jgi:hypothetical protein
MTSIRSLLFGIPLIILTLTVKRSWGKNIVKPIVIKKLFQSIGELETAISKARTSFTGKGEAAEEVLDRIKYYENILNKQKRLTNDLCSFAMKGDWAEVNRHVKLINALSLMIRDDARELLSPVPLRSVETEIEVEYIS